MDVDNLLWPDYKRPICPAIMTGIHIDNVGNCIVDRVTGLNCKWFLLTEPMPWKIGDIRQHSLVDLHKGVRDYRKKCFGDNTEEIEECEKTDFVFDGCGGNPREIIKLARKHLL